MKKVVWRWFFWGLFDVLGDCFVWFVQQLIVNDCQDQCNGYWQQLVKVLIGEWKFGEDVWYLFVQFGCFQFVDDVEEQCDDYYWYEYLWG